VEAIASGSGDVFGAEVLTLVDDEDAVAGLGEGGGGDTASGAGADDEDVGLDLLEVLGDGLEVELRRPD
jgi:hypothetical protein